MLMKSCSQGAPNLGSLYAYYIACVVALRRDTSNFVHQGIIGCVSPDAMGMHSINFEGSTNASSFQKLIKNIKYVPKGLMSCFKLDYRVYYSRRFPGGFNLDLCVTRINKRGDRYRK